MSDRTEESVSSFLIHLFKPKKKKRTGGANSEKSGFPQKKKKK